MLGLLSLPAGIALLAGLLASGLFMLLLLARVLLIMLRSLMLRARIAALCSAALRSLVVP
jgi:hypothetical protein